MRDKYTICILGGTGTVAISAYKVLSNLPYHFRVGVRNKAKAKKYYLYARADNVELFEVDLDRINSLKDFYTEADLVIGAAGPSARYSEIMLQAAVDAGIPYIDPGGMHLREKYLERNLNITAVVGAGLFPGLSGWILRSILHTGKETERWEVIIGGEYNFSYGAAVDYVEETKGNAAGVPMACVRNGTLVPAEKMIPTDIPDTISGLTFLPYITEEIQEIFQEQKISNIDAYTAGPAKMFAAITRLRGKDADIAKWLKEEKNSRQRAVIWIKKTTSCAGTESIFFEGRNPGELTGKILALSANAVIRGKKKKGIFSMASYLKDYPLIEELKKIEDFRYEKDKI